MGHIRLSGKWSGGQNSSKLIFVKSKLKISLMVNSTSLVILTVKVGFNGNVCLLNVT